MDFVCNFPLFMIIGGLFSAVLCLMLKRKAAYTVTGILLALVTAADAAVLYYTVGHGSFTYKR